MDGAPIRQDDYMLPFGLHRVAPGGIYDDRPIMSDRLLHARMAVIPIGAGLPHGKFIGKGLTRSNAGEADAGNAIHLERQDQTMPVDRRVFLQMVGDREADILPLLQPDERRGQRAVDHHRMGRAPAG